MQLILDIGQLMMENGASSKRVVRDMLRAAAYLGIYWENVQIHITYSTIMINVDDGVTSETMFRKCYKHGVNMMTTLLANQLSWDALTSNESYLIYRNQMMTIQQMAILIALLNLFKAYNNLIAMKMVECYIKDILLKGIMK